MSKKIDYAASGVNIEAGNEAVRLMKAEVSKTYTPAVLSDLGTFGSLYDLKTLFNEYDHPVLVQSIDGVGTKSIVAEMADDFSNLGEDLLSATANDILVMGAKPLTLLDYIASDKIDPKNIANLVNGLAKACQRNSVALVGGETAEMPDTYCAGAHDFVGVVTGVVDKSKIIDGKSIKPGDKLIALESSGLHTNGFSLARYILFKQNNFDLNATHEHLNGMSLKDALLAPHINYQTHVHALLDNNIEVKGMAHITGGGLIENLPRILPDNCAVDIDINSWDKNKPGIFNLLVELGDLPKHEAYRTFNMGVGYVFVLAQDQLQKAQDILSKTDIKSYEIGEVVEFDGNIKVKL
jgi:phosphoribosylformylglycinamidine cyclo-ligase